MDKDKSAELHFDILPLRPDVVLPATEPEKLSAGFVYKTVLNDLKKGKKFCFEGTFGTALSFYSWLKKQINLKYPVHDYFSSRQNKHALFKYADNLLLRISNYQAALTGAPQNGWLKILYPEEKDFFLRFTDFLGMNGAWQWFKNGIHFPDLDKPVHPFYGVYFPTRNEHISLFNSWLLKQSVFQNALDIGTGCGVLSRFMLQNNISQITATDINRNSLISLKLDLDKYGGNKYVKLIETSLFEGLDVSSFDLIVFNPPWIPEKASGILDQAMYYDHHLFEKFFSCAFDGMRKDALLLILFSTFANAAGITLEHPIEKEIGKGRFELIEKMQQPVLQSTSGGKDWLSSIRSKEVIELWVLRKKK